MQKTLKLYNVIDFQKLHVAKILGAPFLPENTRLPQPGRPHQAFNMSENSRNGVFLRKKAPAAAGKTSTGLIHVIKSQERHFCRKKGACGSREDLTKPNTCHIDLHRCTWDY